jgi:hypothetical protein
MQRPEKPNVYSQEEWNHYVWGSWNAAVNECEHFKGMDLGGRGLCHHKENPGTIPQENSCLRCNIFLCPDANKIYDNASTAGVEQ